MLSIKNIKASVEGKEILKGINLEIKAGEVHAIMGPNGSGKSTLSAVLSGKDEFEVTEGEVTFEGKDLLEMQAEVRAREGIFLAFQYPVEIPGVSNINFLKTVFFTQIFSSLFQPIIFLSLLCLALYNFLLMLAYFKPFSLINVG